MNQYFFYKSEEPEQTAYYKIAAGNILDTRELHMYMFGTSST